MSIAAAIEQVHILWQRIPGRIQSRQLLSAGLQWQSPQLLGIEQGEALTGNQVGSSGTAQLPGRERDSLHAAIVERPANERKPCAAACSELNSICSDPP